MASAAVALADSCQIHGGRTFRPRVRSNGNFYAKGTLADADTVDRIGMEIVRNEFIVAFEFEVGDVEKDGAVFFLRALAQNFYGALMTFQQWRQDGADEWLFEYLRQGFVG